MPDLERSGAYALLAITVVVLTLVSWLQESVSRTQGLAKESLVLAESGAYVAGGLLVPGLQDGLAGLRRCISPKQYILFMPVSMAFLAANFWTYTAVSGMGASQFFLLCQLRVAISAVMMRLWRGVQQSAAEWLALLQLSLGLLLLVHLQLSAGTPDMKAAGMAASVDSLLTEQDMQCLRRPYPWRYQTRRGMCFDGHEASEETLRDIAALSADVTQSDAVDSQQAYLAFAGVLASVTVAYIYMESQLKARGSESIAVQLHQMNFGGALASFGMYAWRLRGSGNKSSLTAGWGLPVAGFWLLLVARGVLSMVIVKQFDSIVKGLADIAAMVGVCILQIVVDRQVIDITRTGLQGMLLLSVVIYFSARHLAKQVSTQSEAASVRQNKKHD